MDETPFDDPDSLAQSTSELQVYPPPRHDELDRLLFHIPLEDFGKKLQLAAEAVFPNNTESRYRAVHVLLLCWEVGDPRLPVERELAELNDVFEDYYHFETETWKIPSKNAHRALNRKITDFVELEDDGRDCLKIVYYGGHGFLSPGRQLMWSNLQSKDEPLYQSVKWHAIQATLEDAESDVLLLLDCCAAGTASTDNGCGVTELLGACAFNVTANGVGEFSFTTALSKELRAFSKVPSFTVGRLYNNLLRRAQMTLSHMTIQKAPIHVVLTQDEKLPRSIQLSPLPLRLEESESALAVAKTDSDSGMPRGSPLSKASVEDSGIFSAESGRSSMTSLSLDSNKMYPRIALSVQLPGNVRPDQLSEDLFRDWLRMIPVVAENVKVEAGWASFSTLLIISVPMLIWRYIEDDPAVRMVGIIRSPNVLIPKGNPEKKVVPSLMDTEAGLNQNFKAGLTIVERWFGELGKCKQRQVLFKLHDTRAAKQYFPQRFNQRTEEISEVDSNDWGSDSESYEDEREPYRMKNERRRSRSRTRSSAGYSESVPDPEMAMVRFEAQPGESRVKTTYSGRDSAYGSTTSGSRSSRFRRNRVERSPASSSSSHDEEPHISRSRNRLGDSFLGASAAEATVLGIDALRKKNEQKEAERVREHEKTDSSREKRLSSAYARPSVAPNPSYYPDTSSFPPAPPSPPLSRPGSYASETAALIPQSWSGQVPPPFRPGRVLNATPMHYDHVGTSTSYNMPPPPSYAAHMKGLSSPAPPVDTATDSPEALQLFSGRPKEKTGAAIPFDPKDVLDLRALNEQLRAQGSPIPNPQASTENRTSKKEHISVHDDEKPPSIANLKFDTTAPIAETMNYNDNTTADRETKLGKRPSKVTQSEDDMPLESERVSQTSSSRQHIRVVSPPREKIEDKAVKGILRQPREKFPEDPSPIRDGVAPLKDARKDGVPPDARWTKINRKLVNPEALELGKERFETRDDFVIVLRVLSKEEVQQYAVATQQIRVSREEDDEDEIAERAERRRKARRERQERNKREGRVSLRHEYHRSPDDASSSDGSSDDIHDERKKSERSRGRSDKGDLEPSATKTKYEESQVTTPTRAVGRTRSPDSTYSSIYPDSKEARS